MDPRQTTHLDEGEDVEIAGIGQSNSVIEENRQNVQIRGDRGTSFRPGQVQTLGTQYRFDGIQINSGAQVHIGDLHRFQNTSLFSSLVMDSSESNLTETAMTTLAKKVRHQAGRQLSRIKSNKSYIPYAKVKNRRIKVRLVQIAKRFQFLDRGFAEYFQVVVKSFNRGHVQHMLRGARETIISRQSRTPNRLGDSESIYLGDLGNFCEATALTWNNPQSPPLSPEFVVTHRRDHEFLHYLQDAFEVPYWEFMSDLFLGWRANSKSLSGEVVLRVLDSLTIDLRDDLRRLHDDRAMSQMDDEEDMEPIIHGIEDRLAVLMGVLDSTTSNPEGREDFLSSVFENTHHAQSETNTKEPQSSETDEVAKSKNETVVLIALIILFLIGAILPGYKAFAISMKNNNTGNTEDADFWYLMQSSIMSVLGNLISVVPLLKKSWFSPAYNAMWLFFTLGLALFVVSICIYPFLNTGWSSVLSFLGSICSVASVLIITQATGRNQGKIKMD